MIKKICFTLLAITFFHQCHTPVKPVYDILGCMDENALNYNSEANVDDGSCIDALYGCMDETSMNFNSEATIEDSSCVYYIKMIEYNTNGYAFNLDVTDNLIALSANYEGTFLFEIEKDDFGDVVNLVETAHLINWEPNDGDEKSNKVMISENHNLLFIMDMNDRIYLYKLGNEVVQFETSFLQGCFGDNWRDFTIDDSQMDSIYIYPLVKHSSADPGAPYSAQSTSLINGVISIDVVNNTFDFTCSYGINHSNIGEYVSFSDSLFALAEGELGVTIYRQFANAKLYNGIWDEGEHYIDANENGEYDFKEPFNDVNGNGVQDPVEEFIDSNNNGIWDEGEDFYDCGEYDWQPGVIFCSIGNPVGNGTWDEGEDFNDLNGNGIWDVAEDFTDGVIPVSEFDLPGEVKTITSYGKTVLTGHSYNKGCYMSFLDNNGNFINKISIANGYNIRGIATNGELVILAAGYDGILIYEWVDNSTVIFLGEIPSGYANSVKIKNNHIYAATRDGLEIYKIER